MGEDIAVIEAPIAEKSGSTEKSSHTSPEEITDEQILKFLQQKVEKPRVSDLRKMGQLQVDEIFLADTGGNETVWYAEKRLGTEYLLQARLSTKAEKTLAPLIAFPYVRIANRIAFNGKDLDLSARVQKAEVTAHIVGQDDKSFIADLNVQPPICPEDYFSQARQIPTIGFDLGMLLKLHETTEYRKQRNLLQAPQATEIEALLGHADKFYESQGVSLPDAIGYNIDMLFAQCCTAFLGKIDSSVAIDSERMRRIRKSGVGQVAIMLYHNELLAATMQFKSPLVGKCNLQPGKLAFIDAIVNPNMAEIEPTLRLVYTTLLEMKKAAGENITAVYSHAFSSEHGDLLQKLGFKKIGETDATPLSEKSTKDLNRRYDSSWVKAVSQTLLPIYEFIT